MSQIRADNITNRQGTGAPIFVNGIRVVGLTSIANIVANTGTFSGAVSIGGTLTYAVSYTHLTLPTIYSV